LFRSNYKQDEIPDLCHEYILPGTSLCVIIILRYWATQWFGALSQECFYAETWERI
jgi:hypothetical protein